MTPLVITGEQFRRDILGIGRNLFYAMKGAGRFDHLRARHLCTNVRTYYVRALCEAWATETLVSGLRPRQSQRRA